MRRSLVTTLFGSRVKVWLMAILLLAALSAAMVSGCTSQPETTPLGTTATETTRGSSAEPPTTTQESSSEPSETGNPIIDLRTLNEIFYSPDFGNVIVSTEFFWSSSADYCLFAGHVRDNQQEFVPGAYLYDVEKDLLVKLLEGQAGDNYYLAEPAWSPDEKKVIVPFYQFEETAYQLVIYDLAADEVSELPCAGTLPAFSPDGLKLAFTNEEGSIDIFDFTKNQILSPTSNILGSSPVWFSDQHRLLYIAPTGNNPSNLEYGWLSEVRLADFDRPDAGQVVMPESSYHRVRWLLEDKLASVESGMDDGFFSEILNIETLAVTDFGESRMTLYKAWDQSIRPVVQDFEAGQIRQFDQNMNETYRYAIAATGSFTAISLLPDDRLLCFSNDPAAEKGYLSVLFPGNAQGQPVAYHSGNLLAITASDGTRAAFFNQDTSQFYILETRDFFSRIH